MFWRVLAYLGSNDCITHNAKNALGLRKRNNAKKCSRKMFMHLHYCNARVQTAENYILLPILSERRRSNLPYCRRLGAKIRSLKQNQQKNAPKHLNV